MIKVCIEPPASMSRAMFRVRDALKKYVPHDVQLVAPQGGPDVTVLHVIGAEGMPEAIAAARRYAVIQYCLRSASGGLEHWKEIWKNAVVVWSYYDLIVPDEARFYYAPLGVDGSVFKFRSGAGDRPVGVVTSGYVSGPAAEAIQEVADAAAEVGLSVTHVGPSEVVGMTSRPKNWTSLSGLPDGSLAGLYGHAQWVSGLRHVEGFELPVIEGLACGARPIVFNRSEMHAWYQGLAYFVHEDNGEALVRSLIDVLHQPPRPVTAGERERVLARFNWRTICEGFWRELLR